MTKQQILQQGAEAKIILDKDSIIKNRISKSYRHTELDKKIIKSRTKREAKLLEKASTLINVPKSEIEEINMLRLEYIKGKKISEHLESLDWRDICQKIGKAIAKLHDNAIIHGDLTTSNMILDENNNLFFIDFGLGYVSSRIEDKAVDLHLIKQALEAKHFSIYNQCWAIIEKNYDPKDRVKILQQLGKVESRGRYKKGC